MIVLNVTYHCKPEMRDAFLERIFAEDIDEACRREAGNIKYDYYVPVDNDDDLLLVEKWKDAEALKKHGAEPHFERLAAFKPEYVAETEIERFEL